MRKHPRGYVRICKSCGREFTAKDGNGKYSPDRINCPDCWNRKRPLRRPGLAKRKCLDCGREFMSSGPGNRICGQCQSAHNDMRGMAVVFARGHGRGMAGIADE